MRPLDPEAARFEASSSEEGITLILDLRAITELLTRVLLLRGGVLLLLRPLFSAVPVPCRSSAARGSSYPRHRTGASLSCVHSGGNESALFCLGSGTERAGWLQQRAFGHA
jgi:hypothetical protein